jgi:sialate O-acetylesterase
MAFNWTLIRSYNLQGKSTMKKKILITCAVLTAVFSGWAEVKLPRLFGDNMILQQNTKNAVWGWASPGEKVTVKASWGAEASGVADKTGQWKIFLETPKYGTGYTLKISGKNSIDIKNVAIGEVWLCAGQSNMGWAAGQSFGGDSAEITQANDPDYRIFKSAREQWYQPLEIPRDRLAKWKSCTPKSAAETSAVSFYFGKKLREELKIPVGIIVQAYAGTPIESWMPKAIQANDARTQAHIKLLENNSSRLEKKGIIDKAKALIKYKRELKAYNKKIDAGQTMKNKTRTLKPPIITRPPNLGYQYPAHVFNAMIYPIRPYGIRGVIWYQGERNSKNAPQACHYRQQLAQLIKYYRKSWHELSAGNVDKNFPFYFTQLPSWNPAQTKPVEGIEATWAINREMMRLVTYDVSNTGMAVAIDTGDAVALHPHCKKPIGIRHAYLALKQTYGKDFIDYGPRYKKQQIKGNKIILEFDSIGGGLMPGKTGKLNSFAVAGKDKKWHWADVVIKGDTIVVSAPAVSTPVAVRYAWAMNPSQRNLLYNKVGLPASPFRTDDWALFDPSAELLKVNKPKKTRKYIHKDWKRPVMTQ